MGISLIYTPPFLTMEHVRKTGIADFVHHHLVRLVTQLCRAKDHEIINEGTECMRSENTMQFSHYHQLADETAAA